MGGSARRVASATAPRLAVLARVARYLRKQVPPFFRVQCLSDRGHHSRQVAGNLLDPNGRDRRIGHLRIEVIAIWFHVKPPNTTRTHFDLIYSATNIGLV
jgi:hypothetical protein